MENPIKMDDLGVPLFLETPIYIYNIYDIICVYIVYIDISIVTLKLTMKNIVKNYIFWEQKQPHQVTPLSITGILATSSTWGVTMMWHGSKSSLGPNISTTYRGVELREEIGFYSPLRIWKGRASMVPGMLKKNKIFENTVRDLHWNFHVYPFLLMFFK